MHYRKEKLEEQIKRIVSELFIREIKDPRIGFVTITGVQLNNDFTLARIGISIFGDARDMRKTMEGLQSAKGFIQSRMGKVLQMRITPKVAFYPDSSVAEAVNLVNLLESLQKENDHDVPGEPDKTDPDLK